ncbi:NineTeen Complex (NTC) component [Kappamyces sp. JEL0680]|nr:NineTeen Complex (NTC) component [Kappamyces sp. JEL0680]
MPRVKIAREDLTDKFDIIRQEDQQALGLVRKNTRRPLTAAHVNSVSECERWRADLITEILGRVERISDPTLDDLRVRDLNDLINKRMKEKKMWEDKIRDLGGPDYSKNIKNDLVLGGATVPGTRGYRYFGRAKQLDGVRELFEQAATMQEKVRPQELVQRVDADYYGYRDEEDGILLRYEARLEAHQRSLILDEYSDVINDELDVDFVLPDAVPGQEDFEAFLVERRRQELAEKYLGSPVKTASAKRG